MRFLFVGDVYGKIGRQMIQDYLPRLKNRYRPSLTIVNGENAAGGRGITEDIYKFLMTTGADVVTLGNHAWDNKGIFEFIDDAKRLVRPANFPEAPGSGIVYVNFNGQEVAVINLQ